MLLIAFPDIKAAWFVFKFILGIVNNIHQMSPRQQQTLCPLLWQVSLACESANEDNKL